ncbi:MAG: hypothetical protein AAF614_10100 [Chloroflexota bacterium]
MENTCSKRFSFAPRRLALWWQGSIGKETPSGGEAGARQVRSDVNCWDVGLAPVR